MSSSQAKDTVTHDRCRGLCRTLDLVSPDDLSPKSVSENPERASGATRVGGSMMEGDAVTAKPSKGGRVVVVRDGGHGVTEVERSSRVVIV